VVQGEGLRGEGGIVDSRESDAMKYVMYVILSDTTFISIKHLTCWSLTHMLFRDCNANTCFFDNTRSVFSLNPKRVFVLYYFILHGEDTTGSEPQTVLRIKARI